jgi:SnoaL-like protein
VTMTIEDLSTWLDAYRRAWEGRDADAAAALFTEDAAYHWGPFEEPLRGREAIRERWQSAVDAQADVSFGHEPLAIGDGSGLARWWVSFVVPAADIRVRLEGIFQVALDDEGACHDFREWWNAEEEQL